MPNYNFINSGPVAIIRTVYYIYGPKFLLMKLNFGCFKRVMNDEKVTLPIFGIFVSPIISETFKAGHVKFYAGMDGSKY